MKHELQHPISLTLAEIINGICHRNSTLIIEEVRNGTRIELNVTPHPSDFPLLCGASGRHVKALKFLAAVAGRKSGLTYELNLLDGFTTDREQGRAADGFELEKFKRLMAVVNQMVFPCMVGMEFNDSGKRLKVFLVPELKDPDNGPIVSALNHIFYPYGCGVGRIIDIKLG